MFHSLWCFEAQRKGIVINMKELFRKILGMLIALAVVIGTGYITTSDGEDLDGEIHPQCEEKLDEYLQ